MSTGHLDPNSWPIPPWVGQIITGLVAAAMVYGSVRTDLANLRAEVVDVRTDVREIRALLLKRP